MYLTYDIGTSALKSALIDSDGAVVAIDAREYPRPGPGEGMLEIPAQTYWQCMVSGTHSVMRKSGAPPSGIAAIGFSSQGQSFIPIGKGGDPLHSAIVWLDNRAQGVADRWAESWLPHDKFRAISGYPRIPAQLTVFKVAWMLEHMPEMRRAWKFLCLPDYLIYRLCGETVADPVIAQMTGFCDLRTGKWSPEMLSAAGISEEQMPTIVDAGTVAGTTLADAAGELGLPGGIPVCVGTNDQIAGAIGAGNVRPGVVTETTGTALAVLATCSELWDTDEMVVGRHAVKGSYFALSYSPTSAAVLRWFRDIVGPDMTYEELLAETGNIPPGCDGLTIMPYFTGTVTPSFNPEARGALVGLSLTHSRAHITKAIMESCVCLLKDCLEPIQRRMETNVIRSLGGAARSDLWLQMKADLLGIPIERPKCADAASLGAAMLAAVGTGDGESIRAVSEAWYRPDKVFTPGVVRTAACQEVYERYLDVRKRLYE